jgi:hypothetical protein
VKKISLKQVACHEYKADIAEIATRLSGAEAGEQPYISVFQAAINELMESLDEDQIARLEETRANWLSRGQPREQQRKAAEKMGRHYLQEASRVQFNNFGMRAVVFEFHENRAGTKLFQM